MKVEIWSDVVCPWCYVGKRNLEAALEGFEHRDEVEIEWRSYELDPHAPVEREGDYATRLATKYGVGLGEARAMIARMVAAGAQAGVDFRFDVSRPGNTFDAHRLLHLAKKRGVQDDLKERLFRATFTDGQPVGDGDALVALAVAAGLDESEARTVVESDQFADEVRADEAEAIELGVRGVPFFVIGRRYGVSGAQPADALREVLRRAWRDTHPIEIVTSGDAGLCDDGNCAL